MNARPWVLFRRALLAGNLLAPILAIALGLLGHPWLGLLLWLFFWGALHWAMFNPTSRWLGPVALRFAPQAPEVWLTIDDGPDPQDTPALLDLLAAHGAKATFFFIGEKAAQYPGLVRRAAEEGHGIGHHTFTHPAHWFWLHGPAATGREMALGRQAVAKAAGLHPATILPCRLPAGVKNPFAHNHLQPGEPLVVWSARAFDTSCRQAGKTVSRLLAGARPGAILLMHEGVVARDGSRLAPQVLEKLLLELDRRHLRPMVPDLAQLR